MFLIEIKLKQNKAIRWDDITIVLERSQDEVTKNDSLAEERSYYVMAFSFPGFLYQIQFTF